MPISKEDFEKGRKEEAIIDRIQNFLASNKNAYTEQEILKRLYPDHHAWPRDHNGFANAMHILTYAEKVKTRYVSTDAGVQIYYGAM